ncbi:MAG: HPr family phosphocarrier protein [Spirochaetes bacterium]|nr:HPr family phosphocarrier protein [Spirochaetota bacterium]
MKRKDVMIKHKTGLHARPASNFVQTAHKFKSDVKIIKDGVEVNGKSIMSVLTLAATFNTKLTIIVSGEDEDKAIDKLCKILEEGE